MTRSPRLRLTVLSGVSALALVCLIGSARAGNLGLPHFGGDVRNGGVNDPNLYIQPHSVTADKLATGAAATNLMDGLPSCTPGSDVAPVAAGQVFQCAGVLLVAQ